MQTRPYEAITVGVADKVATVTMSIPERKNPLGPLMVNELLYALDDARDDDDVRCVVITGAGGAFSAGGDLKQMGGGDGDGPALEPKGDYVDLMMRFTTLGKPTVARIEGPARGGALGIIASCDFAVAADTATLGTPEIRRGLWPMMIMAVLQRVMSRRQLMNMMLLGEKMTAEQARGCELVSHVAPEDELDARLGELTAKLAAQSPTAMRMGLRAFHWQADHNLENALPYLRDQLFTLLGTEDAREGLTAFFEKREPHWTGK